MFMFSHIFFLLWGFTFPMFWELYELTEKISPNPRTEKIWVFPSISHEMGKKVIKFPQKLIAWERMVFHRIFTCYENLYIPRHAGLHEFLSNLNL